MYYNHIFYNFIYMIPKILREILSEFKEHVGKRRYYSCFILIIIISAILSLEPLFFGAVLRELEESFSTGVFNTRNIIYITVFWLIYTIVFNLTKFLVMYECTTRSCLIDYQKSIKKYCHYTNAMTMQTYLSKRIGSIYKLIDRGTDSKLFFFFSFFELYLFNVTQILCIVVILFLIDVKMALISLLFVPIMFWCGRYFTLKTSLKQAELSKKWEDIFAVVWNAMSNFWLFKILGLQKRFWNAIDTKTDSVYIEQMQLNRSWVFSEIYTVICVMLSRIFVLIWGIYYIQKWELTMAELFVIFSYIWWIYFPLWFISRELRNSVRQLTETQRMYDELWDMEKEMDLDLGAEISQVSWNLEFKKVNFWYNNSKDVLKNVSISIEKGKKIALVGDTGSWKSTIVNLLLRFWDPKSWEINIDGKNINTLNKNSLRKHIWVVSQDNSLFNLSIRENLSLAKESASEKELERALKNAKADFVFDLPKGIDTVIWERWLKLSWWEKQRISIARLFLKNPEILVLDEATSALDNKTEKLIQASLDSLLKWKTSLIIAHRLSTIQNADLIYVLENGTIVESWNYTELMNKKWKFYSIANPDKLIIW